MLKKLSNCIVSKEGLPQYGQNENIYSLLNFEHIWNKIDKCEDLA